MKYLLIRDDATIPEIEAAISELRARQLRAVIASTRLEIADDIDELFDMRAARREVNT